MSESTTAAGSGEEGQPAAPAGDPSAFANLIGALVAPRATFESLARRPTTALALVVLVLLGAAAVWVAMGKVSPEGFVFFLEESGQELPPEMSDDPERILRFALWWQLGSMVVLGPAFYFAVAGLLLVLFRLLGSELTFRQSLATSLHGMLPLGVAALVGIAVAFGRDEIGMEELQFGGIVASNLGFLAGEEAGKATRALLTSVDLFSAWCVALLAYGYRIVARVGAGAAWGAILALWVLGVLIKLAMVSF